MLIRLTELSERERAAAVAALTEIFFAASSRTEFESANERTAFLTRWTAYYLDDCTKDVWLWRDHEGGYAGYLTGCHDSGNATALRDGIGSYQLFEDQFGAFPAHLHVNCRADRRGGGIGAALVERFVADCGDAGLPGVHIVTHAEARNVGFYHRLGFRDRVRRSWAGLPLLFMGYRLT